MTLEAEIANATRRLAELEHQRAEATRRLASLQQRRATAGKSVADADERSAAEKLAIFRSLFRGRTDVFAARWENNARSRSGYSPRCAHEWRAGICGKPKVRCGACPNQAFVELGDRELLAHLRGHQVLGIYPLLADDTCQLLAIDLDGGSWSDDVHAIRAACRSLGIEPAVERSRSGAGAHIWFFFSDAVPAVDARRLGFTVLTRAMSSGADIGIDSYDRLFPSQDVLPTGGFGNLIALPLQRGARKDGNTEFLDEDLTPHPDQWSYLASLERIAPQNVTDIAAAVGTDAELAVRTGDGEHEAPWSPPHRLRERLQSMPMPKQVHATLADRLYFERDELPSALAHAVKRTATFSNPAFLELQRMRLSVAKTPRVIACFEDLDQHLAVPRGCLTDVEPLLAALNIRFELKDERSDGSPLDVGFHGQLTDSQQKAAKIVLKHDTGVLCAPPGWGKTVLATHLIATRGCSTLVLVHRKPLVEQWISRLAEFLDLPGKRIGAIGGGRCRITGKIDVAMIQSLARSENPDDTVRRYGHVIVDECHHVPAVSMERVLASLHARYVIGLTATPKRRDGHHPILAMQCGPIRHRVTSASPTESSGDFRVTQRTTAFAPKSLPPNASIQEVYTALAADAARLHLVCDDVRQLMDQGRAILLLTERRDHLDRLAAALFPHFPHLLLLHGGVKAKARREALEQLATDESQLVLATGRYIGEGFDAPRLDTLMLTMPIAWKGTIVQYAGRLHRAHPDKHSVRIYDYVDHEIPVLRRMFAKRLSTYRDLGYSVDANNQIGLPLEPSSRLPES